MTTTTTHTVRTRSTHPFAIVKIDREAGTVVAGEFVSGVVTGVRIIGYAASEGPAVVARARRAGGRIVPIVAGAVSVEA